MYKIEPLIYIGQNILEQCLPYVQGRQVCVVTQKEIPDLMLQKLKNLFSSKTLNIVYIPEGETAKSWATVEYLMDQFVAAKFNRECTVVALGGGVVGDVAGFAASIYLRGVNFIQMPTTLLAQVDASVGGKTAINHAQGKNLIGTFYQATSVIIDIDSLQTLAQRDYIAGLAEVVKIACVRDADFFAWLEQHVETILVRESGTVMQMIHQAVKLKAQIVKADEKEQGERMLLNFGHTVAHAIETASAYDCLHGEAVAMGMVQALALSQEHGLSVQAVQRIIALLQGFGLPTQLPENGWQKHMAHDKKHRDSGLNRVLLAGLGQGMIHLEALASEE